MKPLSAPRSFALLSPCGHGNLGDAAIQAAVMQNIRSRIPQASFYGITMNPSDTERRHGIPTYPISASSRPGYCIKYVEESTGEAGGEKGGTRSPGTDGSIVIRAKRGLKKILVGFASLVISRKVLWTIQSEMKHIAGGIRLLRRIDMLVISGGGQLDDFWGGAWGHPYALLKWTLLAFLLRKRVAVLSVGFGSLQSRASRFLTRRALAFADYLSYRDYRSKNLMQQAGYRREGSVYPDLAFSLDIGGMGNRRNIPTPSALRVGILPMVYCDPRIWPIKNQTAYITYLNKLVDIASTLIRRQYSVVLFPSDTTDHFAVDDVKRMLMARLTKEEESRLEVPVVRSVEQFLEQAVRTDFTIASRMHGVLLSFLAVVPVISISYDRKVADLMTTMGHNKYCLDINLFSPDQIIDLFSQQEKEWSLVREQIVDKVGIFRHKLSLQYGTVFSSEVGVVV